MASAYELMLVLRGRNYLSNDLRKAGADIRRMQTIGGLQNHRGQLQINAQRLASSKAIAQSELASIATGTRRVALNKALAAQKQVEANALQAVRRQEEALLRNDASRYRNAVQLSTLNRRITSGSPLAGRTMEETKQLRDAAQVESQRIAQARITIAQQLAIAKQAYANTTIAAQGLVEREAALAQRSDVLRTKINTLNAEWDLNTVKMNENALAMKRLPLEQLGARARYVEHLGRAFQTLGLFAAAGVGVAAYTAAKFQTGGTLAGTQLVNAGNSSPQNITRLGRVVNTGIENFMASGQSVASAAELQQAAYNIPSGIPSLGGPGATSVQKAKETIALIKEFNRVTKANYGLVDLNGVTQAGIILINTFGTSVGHLPHEFDVMQSAVNRGKLTMGEFVSGLSQTAPAAKAAGYNFDAMAGTLSFLSGKLPQYTRVAVGYARALELFQNPKFEAYMKAHGAAVTDLNGKLLPYNQIISQILKVDPALAKGGNLIDFLKTASGATGFMQARRVLTVSLQDLAGLARATREVPANAQGLVNASAQALSQTGAVKWKELTTEIKALTIEIGTGAIPVIQQLAKPLENAVHWFNQLDPATKHQVGQFAAWSAAGLLLIGTFGVLLGAFTRGYVAIRLFLLGKGGVADLEGGFIKTGTALRLGLIGTLIIAIPLMMRYHHAIGEVVNALGGFKHVVTLLGLAFLALKLTKAISGIRLVGSAATVATGEVDALRASLLSINGLVVTAAVVITYESFVHKKAIINAINRGFKAAGLPGIGGANIPIPANQDAKDAAFIRNALRGAQSISDVQAIQNLVKDGTPAEKKIVSDFIKSHPAFGPNGVLKAPTTPAYKSFIGAAKTAQARARLASDRAAQVRGLSRPGSGFNPAGGDPGITDANIADAARRYATLDELAQKKPTVANIRAANNYLNDIQTKFSKDQFAIFQQMYGSLESQDSEHTRKTVSEAEKRARALKRARDKAVKDAKAEIVKDADALQNTYQSLYQQNQSAFGGTFSGPYSQSARYQNMTAWGHKITGKDLMRDIRSQIFQFKTWRRDINNLRKRGAPFALIQQLEQAGPGSLDEVKALLTLNRGDTRSYFRMYTQGQDLVQVATKQDMTLQLGHYRQYGRNIALQIIQGLRDENTPMRGYFVKIVKEMFPGLAARAVAPPRGSSSSVDNSTTVVVHGEPTLKQQVAARHAAFAHRARVYGRGD